MADQASRALVLTEEAKLAATTAQGKYATFSQVGGFSLVVLAAAAGVSSGGVRVIIVLASPLVLCVIVSFLAMLYTDALALGIYHQHLQRRLLAEYFASDSATPTLRYHQVLNQRTLYSILAIQVTFAVVIASSYVVGGVVAFHVPRYSWQAIMFFFVSLVLGLLLLIAAVIDILGAEKQAVRRLTSDGSQRRTGALGVRSVDHGEHHVD